MSMILTGILGAGFIILVLWDAFETIVFPRRVTRRFRLTRLFYRSTWLLWSGVVRRLNKKKQDTYLSYFGPLSLIFLLSVWAGGVIFGFGLVHWSSGSAVSLPEGSPGFCVYLYLSGTTFFTLGLGDVAPVTQFGRALTVVESGVGLGLLALVISYLPALNQSFSRREMNISLLDARAGSPPSVSELLRRRCGDGDWIAALNGHLEEWERWTAELLESHLSYPVLAYFRSQHDNQSWLSALTTILDTSAFVMSSMEGACARQAQLTFAIARHAVVDLSLVFRRSPHKQRRERLSAEDMAALRKTLSRTGITLRDELATEEMLTGLRQMYEPYVNSLSRYLMMPLPPWMAEQGRPDNWEVSAWGRGQTQREKEASDKPDEHF